MLIYKESVGRIIRTLFCNNLNYKIMSNRTFAQEAVLKRIEEKEKKAVKFQDYQDQYNDYSDYDDYNDYNDYNDCSYPEVYDDNI